MRKQTLKGKVKGKEPYNPLMTKYSQLSRQFQLILDSNKVKFRNELADLVVRLKAGSKLLNEMAKSQGAEINDKYGALKGFNQANNYLIHKLVEVVEQIEQLQVEHVNSVVLLKNEKNLIVSEGK